MENEYSIVLEGIQGQQNESFYISENAVFPEIKPTCTIDNLQSGDRIQRAWAALKVSYTANGRNDLWNATVELLKQAATQTIPVKLPELRGGTLSVQCFATIKDSAGRTHTISSNVYTTSILAKQPIKKNVREILKHNYLHAVVFKRSAFEQFAKDGNPVFNKGFGIYRIANPSAVAIWNWKTNASVANTDFEQRIKTASLLPEKLRTENPDEYNGLPDFTPLQTELQALQSYGTGNYYKPDKNIFGNWKWEKSTANDGYADSCLLLLKDVSGGKLPVGWD